MGASGWGVATKGYHEELGWGWKCSVSRLNQCPFPGCDIVI